MDESNIDNVFVSSSKGQETYTLSLYSRADRYNKMMKGTSQNNWMQNIEQIAQNSMQKGGAPPAQSSSVEDSVVISSTKKLMPDFKSPSGFQMLMRGSADEYRVQ